ncbi:MAG: RNA polymerase sigma factor, partial [Oceanicaulis sp.]|nr:RNA polymerase sigma factor [Oceanicaulis sp.]
GGGAGGVVPLAGAPRHQQAVRALLVRLTRQPSLADDLAQETFLKAWTRIASFRAEGSFKAWLCAIAYAEFLMSARKARAARRLADSLAAEPGETSAPPGPAGERVDLDRALAHLAEDERTCVVLCYASGLSHSEAAQVTGLPVGTVKSHVNRGRAKLKRWFERKEAA